jgi:3-phosphoinositide dependent protein kinase-1
MDRNQPGFRLEDFIVESPIGQGAFGQIYRASSVSTGEKFALKAVNRRYLIKMKKQNVPVLEKTALVKCAGPFVVPLIGTFKDDSNLYFVFGLAEHGDLAEAIGEIGALNTDVCRMVSAQVLAAISGCHKAGVIHRDIKTENVLLDSRNYVILADFGTALLYEESSRNELVRSSIVGTPSFVAPELLTEGRICFASDLWAFGCLIFNILTGVAPFEGGNVAELMTNITSHRFTEASSRIPRLAKDLIERLLELDPRQRIGFGESECGYPSIRSHPFFRGVPWDSLDTVTMPLFTPFEPDPPPSIADPFLLEDEKVIMEATVDRKRVLGWKDRIAVLTNGKRFFLFNSKEKKVKLEIRLAPTTKVTMSGRGREWTIHWGKNSQVLRSNDGQAAIWAATILREATKQ